MALGLGTRKDQGRMLISVARKYGRMNADLSHISAEEIAVSVQKKHIVRNTIRRLWHLENVLLMKNMKKS